MANLEMTGIVEKDLHIMFDVTINLCVSIPETRSYGKRIAFEGKSRAKSDSLTSWSLAAVAHSTAWDDISMEFIEGLPPSNGKNTILVVVDRLTKSAHFLPLAHPFTAKVVAEKFVEFVLAGTSLKMSSSYHPQTDGQTEVVNRCVEQYLHCFVNQQPQKWCSLLPWAEYWYNTAYHSSSGMTPFQALYGRLPPPIPHYDSGFSPVNEVDQQLTTRVEILRLLKTNLQAANNSMQQVANSKRRDLEFQIGDWIFL
uniref:Integrase catalytic domain-containing protein n=1 Tax=Salix viminalis TaxID=40686 RepID=A0A6N2LI73_SALVM